jgi:hypothetical protein
METMKEMITRLVELAEEWAQHSKKVNGWETRTYSTSLDAKLKHVSVWCYFDESGKETGEGHISVSFTVDDDGYRGYGVAFHSTPKVELEFSNKVFEKFVDDMTAISTLLNVRLSIIDMEEKLAALKAEVKQ